MKKQNDQIFQNVQKKNELTRQGFERLQARLKKSEQELKAIREELAHIRSTDGINLPENPYYMSLLTDEHAKRNDVRTLMEEINNSVIVEANTDDSIIGVGDKALLELLYSGDDEPIRKSFMLVGSFSNPSNAEISKNSPIGTFIFGKEIGTEGEVVLPNGDTVNVKIISKE